MGTFLLFYERKLQESFVIRKNVFNETMKRIAAMRQIYAAENVLLLKNRYDILGIEKGREEVKEYDCKKSTYL